MWRVAVMAVLILDIVLLILGEGSAFDAKCTEITRLVEAREHPTTKGVRAFETAREITQEAQRNAFRRGERQQARSFALRNPTLIRSPNSIRLRDC
jgi:hypothetical protein